MVLTSFLYFTYKNNMEQNAIEQKETGLFVLAWLPFPSPYTQGRIYK